MWNFLIRTSSLLLILVFVCGEAITWRTRASGRTVTQAIAPPVDQAQTERDSSYWQRLARYARYDPPKILPDNDVQIVKAGTTYNVRCEGHGRGVSWRIPSDSKEDLRKRISQRFSKTDDHFFIAELFINNLAYTDTGTYFCIYNGTIDVNAIDNTTSIHLYVDDGIHLLRESEFNFYQKVQGSTFTFPCMPTHPDVNVTLWRQTHELTQVLPDKYVNYNPKVGFKISPVMTNLHSGDLKCVANFRGKTEEFPITLLVLHETRFLPTPFINQTLARHVKQGEDLKLSCTVMVDFNVRVDLSWKIPNEAAVKENRVVTDPQVSRNLSLAPGVFYKQEEQALIIKRATRDDQGLYECTAVDHSKNTKSRSEFIRVLEKEESYVRIYFEAYQTLEVSLSKADKDPSSNNDIQWVLNIEAFPLATVEWYDPAGKKIDPIHDHRYEIQTSDGRRGQTMLRIKRVTLSMGGDYTVKVFNEAEEKVQKFTLIVKSEPKIQLSVENPQSLYLQGMEQTLRCAAKGFPVPDIQWMFKPCSSYVDCDNSRTKTLQSIENKKFAAHGAESILKVVASESGKFICQACNKLNCVFEDVKFFVTDVPNEGFAVQGPPLVMEGQPFKMNCSASRFNFKEGSLQWFKDSLEGPTLITSGEETNYDVTSYSNDMSFGKEISFDSIRLADKGRYVCKVVELSSPYYNKPESLQEKRAYDYINGQSYSSPVFPSKTIEPKVQELSFRVIVQPLEPPEFVETNLRGDEPLVVDEPSLGLMLKCRTVGRPKPTIQWFIHGKPLDIPENTTRIQLLDNNQVLQINYVTSADEGFYECQADNVAGSIKASKLVQLLDTTHKDALYENISIPVIIVVAISLLLVALLIILAKCFYHKKGRSKSDDKPQTPRLTQYELPQSPEDDECRMTLTSLTSRDGSISPGNTGTYGSHMYPRATPCQDPCLPCHGHIHQPYTMPMMVPPCSLCEYSMQTLPPNRMNTLGSKHTLGRYDLYRSRSQSPRLSAEF